MRGCYDTDEWVGEILRDLYPPFLVRNIRKLYGINVSYSQSVWNVLSLSEIVLKTLERSVRTQNKSFYLGPAFIHYSGMSLKFNRIKKKHFLPSRDLELEAGSVFKSHCPYPFSSCLNSTVFSKV